MPTGPTVPNGPGNGGTASPSTFLAFGSGFPQVCWMGLSDFNNKELRNLETTDYQFFDFFYDELPSGLTIETVEEKF